MEKKRQAERKARFRLFNIFINPLSSIGFVEGRYASIRAFIDVYVIFFLLTYDNIFQCWVKNFENG